jgi:cytidine deaminase
MAGPAAAVCQPAVAATQPVATPDLRSLLPEKHMVLSPEQVEELKKKTGMTNEQLLLALIPIARESARPPVSQYLVGAAGMGKSGAIYLGVNLEFPQQALNQTVHGEQCVTANAMAHGETGLKLLAVSAEPCGHCRQFLNELDNGSNLTVLVPNDKARQLSELLPQSFGPGDLGVKAGLLSSQDNQLAIDSVRSSDTAQDTGLTLSLVGLEGVVAGCLASCVLGPVGFAVVTGASALAGLIGWGMSEGEDDELRDAALDAANKSYAPYSKDPSGIAIRTDDGAIYKGFYAENAAFNPSLSPLQSALISMVVDGKKWDDIKNVALVERKSAAENPHAASQETATRTLLDHIAPGARLTIYNAVQP